MAIGLPVKANYAAGDILTATNMNDLSGTFNQVATSYGNAAGKNKIINGDFAINQRNFTSSTTGDTYSFDRFIQYQNGGTTYSAQTFSPGAAPVAGYEAKNYARIVTTGASTYALYAQLIEDVRTLAGQTATISFWAKAASGTPFINAALNQNFGSGGSGSVVNYGTKQAITTSWARYTWTISIPSISGKTIGTNSFLSAAIYVCDSVLGSGVGNQVGTFDIWGVQVEAGSIATPFQTASGGSIQGELAMCQRYARNIAPTTGQYGPMAMGFTTNTTNALIFIPLPPEMRTTPTLSGVTSAAANFQLEFAGAQNTCTALALAGFATASNKGVYINATSTGLTADKVCTLRNNNTATNILLLDAEL